MKMLTVGQRVRHAYDGAKGTVVTVGRRAGMVRVHFDDGMDDWAVPGDVVPMRDGRRKAPA